MKMKLLATALTAAVSLVGAANAAVIATSAIGATSAPFVLGDFGNAGTTGLVSTSPIALTNGTITFTTDNSMPRGGVYDGSMFNVFQSAYNQTGLSSGNYLAAEPGNPVTITFNSTQTQLQVLWGSVDSWNTLSLTLSGSAPAITVTGGQILALTGVEGPAFVTIDGVSFDTVTLTSTVSALEFVPSVTVAQTSVPEPASLALLGAGLAGVAVARRRRTT